MSPRFRHVCGLDLRHNLRRPLFWIWLLVVVLVCWAMSSGNMRIQSGDSTVGGEKSWITSEFANSQLMAAWVLLIYGFFVAVAAGLTILRDRELRVHELLHSTPLRPGEYVWGKFTACLVSFVAVVAVHVAAAAVFNHLVRGAESADFVGPFRPLAYLKPALVFALPTVVFLAGTSFLIGEWTRRPILVFVLPVVLLMVCGFFLWSWSPAWLDPGINRLLMAVDPSGMRWLNERWLKVDRGVEFYNNAAVGIDGLFLLNRLGFTAIGVGSVFLARWHFARTMQRARAGSSRLARLFGRRRRRRAARAVQGMTSGRPGLVRGMLEVARVEFRELCFQPGLYLFVPLILLQVVGNSVLAVGAFDTPLLVTPGTLAVTSFGLMTTLTCLLVMFYMVESLRREEGTRLGSIYYATPVRTVSIVFGKALANSFVCVTILAASLAAMAIALAIQGVVPFDPRPFALVWGLLLVPTLVLWCTFVSAVYALTRNRFTAYGVALGVLTYTGYELVVGELTWVGNWPLWGALRWSDMGAFELDRLALVYSRLLAVTGAVFFTALAVRIFPRRSFDATRVVLRLRPAALLRTGLRLLPYAAAPLVLAGLLRSGVQAGYQGEDRQKLAKDYWRKNLATWHDAPQPDLAGVDVHLELDPARSWMKVDGTFQLANLHEDPLRWFALTGGLHWRGLVWTMNGGEYEPEDRAGLYVFTPPEPLQPGGGVEVGFAFEGYFPGGISERGGGASQFVLPSGVVLHNFTPSFVPTVGFSEGRGVDEENEYDSEEYADDFYVGLTRSAFGVSQTYPVRTRITAPAEYTMNGVGTLVSDEVTGGERTVLWESDHPVRFFNVVGGKWEVRRGEGTALYYHPEHTYNVEEMIEALDAARRYYSEWYYPFPWELLKVSEFPALADYAQGFPTNITFSESIGFLTESDPRANAAFLVTAHEAAHQWWGNILNPGEGPGGNLLSEGKAHFATIMLFEAVKGPHQRIGFCKNIEERYNDTRQVDSERELVKIDGSRAGDVTVTYDKAGWVFWMLLHHMGRENALEGIRSFVARYAEDRDHPVLQDYVAHMRPYAPDPEAYDAFVQQWFFEVVLPEYELSDAELTSENGTWTASVTVRNAGTGRMPVEVAASAGERFPDEEDGGEEPGTDPSGAPAPGAVLAAGSGNDEPYREARSTVVLDAGEEQRVEIPCAFEPERIVVDPDALVLQRGRERASLEL